jgi:hypothetical protein
MKRVMNSTSRLTLRAINPKTMVAAGMIVIAICARGQQAVAAKPSASPSPFAGTYCGYWISPNSGSMTISDSGSVSGYFSFLLPTFSESYSLSGQVTSAGVMRLKVVHTITVNDRRRRTQTERYSVTVNVVVDASGNLVATSGASFVLSPCQ